MKSVLKIFTGKALAIFFVIASVTFMWQSDVAEAGANINWKTTSVEIQPGRAIVKGYFYNTGNARGAVTRFVMRGYIAQYKINVTYSGSNITVGSIGPGNRINWSFTITDRSISYYDSNPRYNFNSTVDWN